MRAPDQRLRRMEPRHLGTYLRFHVKSAVNLPSIARTSGRRWDDGEGVLRLADDVCDGTRIETRGGHVDPCVEGAHEAGARDRNAGARGKQEMSHGWTRP